MAISSFSSPFYPEANPSFNNMRILLARVILACVNAVGWRSPRDRRSVRLLLIETLLECAARYVPFSKRESNQVSFTLSTRSTSPMTGSRIVIPSFLIVTAIVGWGTYARHDGAKAASSPISASSATSDDDGNRAGFRRKTDFEILNNSPLDPDPRRRIVGVGGLPVHLKLSDVGNWNRERRLQVVVAVYTRADANSYKIAQRVGVFVHPDVLTTKAGQESVVPFETDIPLQSGEYLACIMLCDPDQTRSIAPESEEQMFASLKLDKGELPGQVTRASVVSVHVE